jgi:deoxyribodipyrimidine photo-lyase
MFETKTDFPISYHEILNRIENLNVRKYAATRNYLNGAVSKLSPYIARGVISLALVKETVLAKHSISDAYKFIFELAWREYFQRVWEQEGNNIFTDLKHEQHDFLHKKLPVALQEANTGINAIDAAILKLYEEGYMHNHLRMYVASVACNIGKAHWSQAAAWMFYHLLDGDIASNTLSWQWVAGSFANKKYYCNQENINRYTGSNQTDTFLDKSYEQLAICKQPKTLQATIDFKPEVFLPKSSNLSIDTNKPTLIYHHYSLDPNWRNFMDANKIFLLDVEHFRKFPVSEKVMDFFVALAKTNLKNLQIFSGTFSELKSLLGHSKIFFKKHPAFQHWQGEGDEPNYLFPEVKNVSGSFMNYWKRCERFL